MKGRFDRIASIEMFEAVGERFWPAYFGAVRERLLPGGLAGLQLITIADRYFEAYRRNVDFIQAYIFPGGMLPSPSALDRQAANAGLVRTSELGFGESYARTLAIWNERFQQAWPASASWASTSASAGSGPTTSPIARPVSGPARSMWCRRCCGRPELDGAERSGRSAGGCCSATAHWRCPWRRSTCRSTSTCRPSTRPSSASTSQRRRCAPAGTAVRRDDRSADGRAQRPPDDPLRSASALAAAGHAAAAVRQLEAVRAGGRRRVRLPLAWSCLGYIAWTVLLLTYAAWGAELTAGYDERSRVTGVREGFVIAGILLAASLPTLAGVPPESRDALALVFRSMLVLLPITLVLLLVTVREPPAGTQADLPFARGLRLALANDPFRRLILPPSSSTASPTACRRPCSSCSCATFWAPRWTPARCCCSISSAACWRCRAGWLSYRLGKHRTWSLSMLWACAIFAWVPFLGHGDVMAFAVICALSGASLGADLAIPPSMQADVVDLDQVMPAGGGGRRSSSPCGAWPGSSPWPWPSASPSRSWAPWASSATGPTRRGP